MPPPESWLKLTSMINVEHILERGSARTNEDRLLITEDLFGVFDGATSLASEPVPLPEGLTGGAIAADTACNVFSRNHYPLPHLAACANTAIMERMTEAGIARDREEEVWCTSAAVVRLKNNTVEWFRTGDAQILLLFEAGHHKALGSIEDHDYPTLTMMKTQSDNTLSNPVLRKQVLKVRASMNQTYGVLNGDDRARDFFNTGTVPLEGITHILLFTDGLSLPSSDPSPRPDFTRLVSTFKALGLSGLHKKIRAVEETDPDRKRYPRFKCHDDIAAIALGL